jgi:hypothetical protein
MNILWRGPQPQHFTKRGITDIIRANLSSESSLLRFKVRATDNLAENILQGGF